LYPFFSKKNKIVISFIFYTMETTSNPNLSTSKGEFSKPPLSKPKLSFGYELHLGFIAVRAQSFFEHDNKDPCHHLQEFEEMCSCMSISGMTQETLKWKLFPFPLIEKTKQWYANANGNTNGDWDELKDKFCLTFFSMSRIISLPRAILDFEQFKKEFIGEA
jgi:hypothetical protein